MIHAYLRYPIRLKPTVFVEILSCLIVLVEEFPGPNFLLNPVRNWTNLILDNAFGGWLATCVRNNRACAGCLLLRSKALDWRGSE
jgi:hypothetical protein